MIYLWALILGVIHAVSFALTSTGPAIGLLHVLSLAGLFYLWVRAVRPIRLTLVFVQGWLTVGLYWLNFSMSDIGGLPILASIAATMLLSLYLSSFYALAAWLYRRYFRQLPLVASLMILPSLWVLAELGRGYFFTGFPWLMGGYAHIDNPLLKGWFALLGAYGVAYWAAFLAAFVVYVILSRRHLSQIIWPVVGTAALLIVGLIVQGLNWGQPYLAPSSVRIVQPNVPQSLKFDPDQTRMNVQKFLSLAKNSPASLTVFPETAITVPWVNIPQRMKSELRNELSNRSILMGGIGVDLNDGTLYNSAFWLTQESDFNDPQRYDKTHLLPFGEVVPSWLQWFMDAMNMPLGGLGRGQGYAHPFDWVTSQGVLRVGVNICYENEFGEELITAWQNGDDKAPNVWINVTNLGWFGNKHNSTNQIQHLIMSRARAMEMARPVLVATNTGISAYVDAQGDVVKQLPADEFVVQDIEVQAYKGLTPYIRWGNTPIIAIALCGLIVGLFSRRKYKK